VTSPDTLLEVVDATLTAYQDHLATFPPSERDLSAETPVDAALATARRGMFRHLLEVHEMPIDNVRSEYYGLTLAEIKQTHNKIRVDNRHSNAHTGAIT
jgi:hypothetical protein